MCKRHVFHCAPRREARGSSFSTACFESTGGTTATVHTTTHYTQPPVVSSPLRLSTCHGLLLTLLHRGEREGPVRDPAPVTCFVTMRFNQGAHVAPHGAIVAIFNVDSRTWWESGQESPKSWGLFFRC